MGTESIEDVGENYRSLLERPAETGETSLAPSRIASQFYCEKKVDLTRIHGDRDTPAKTRGSEIHAEATAGSEAISDEEFWAALETGDRQIIVESPFVGEAAEFLLGGVPDAVVFEDQQPQLLFERKTTARPTYLYKNQRLQAWLYGFMLDSLGFDIDALRIAVLSHDRSLSPRAGKRLQELILGDRAFESQEPGEYEVLDSPQAILYLWEFSKLEYLEDLDWALGYWRDERSPTPMATTGKCQACEYNDVCPDSDV